MGNNSFLEKHKGCINDNQLSRTTQRNIVLRENRSRYLLRNESGMHVSKIKVENCIAVGHGKKGCEAIFYVEQQIFKGKKSSFEAHSAFFVELKGCSVGDAIKQIENSFEITKSDLKNIPVYGRIVPTEYKKTKFLISEQQKLHIKFLETGGNLIIRERLTDQI